MVQNGIRVFRNVVLPIVQGKTAILEFAVLDSAGAAVDVSTGYTARVAGRATRDTTATIFDGDGTTKLALAAGKITLTVSATDSAALAAGAAGVLGIELTKTAGAVVTDLVDGTFTVEASPVHA